MQAVIVIICVEYLNHLNPFILMDYPIHIDTLSMELFILYFKGFPVKISIKWYISAPGLWLFLS